MEFQTGAVLQGYRILSLLGEGGMGEVYLAEETLLGRKVAIKRLNPQFTKDPQFAERFLNEARIQAKLIHPNIVALLNFIEENGVFYMIMEYAEGRMLKNVIAVTGPIPEQRTLHIFKQLISALAYAHAKQIIHRDIKPSNIMIDASDNVKVMDFGIARLLSDRHMTRTGAKLGTLYYMSPEQVLADKSIDHRTDIYSAGIVLYEMLTGKLPYTADTDSDFIVMKEITEKRTPDPREVYPHISKAMVQLVQELTAKDRNQRPDGESIATKLGLMQGKPESYSKAERQGPKHSIPLSLEESIASAKDIPKPLSNASIPTSLPDINPKRRSKPWLVIVVVAIGLLIVPFILSKGCKAKLGVNPAADTSITEVTPAMIKVEGGTFYMGSNGGENDEHPVHQVRVASFYISKYEVTQKEWQTVMGSNPSEFKGDNLPVESITWYEAIDYCNNRSLREGLKPCYSGSGDALSCDWTANGYRLPTEAEWEYAARGDKLSQGYTYSGSNDLGTVAWYNDNSGEKTHEVGTKSRNELGLFDMSGNVWEWCWDWYGDYHSNADDKPYGESVSNSRLLRGGSWFNSEDSCRVANRSGINPGGRDYDGDSGVRVVRAFF